LTRDTSRLPAAVEEILRWEAPLQFDTRTLTRAFELDGRSLPEGSRVVLLYGSANRDERRWESPEVLDVNRPPMRHLAFGEGIHHCLGAPLARLEAEIALRIVLRRIPEYEVVSVGELVTLPMLRLRSSVTVAFEPQPRADRNDAPASSEPPGMTSAT
jgi:cytochrome P450